VVIAFQEMGSEAKQVDTRFVLVTPKVVETACFEREFYL
jgi:hypothetical protein